LVLFAARAKARAVPRFYVLLSLEPLLMPLPEVLLVSLPAELGEDALSLELGALEPPAPCCCMQLERSAPDRPSHWLGTVPPPALLVELDGSLALEEPAPMLPPELVEPDGALGDALVSDELLPLVDCAHAALARSAAATAAATDFNVIAGLLARLEEELRAPALQARCRQPDVKCQSFFTRTRRSRRG
jgi:hypothetical protein